MFFTDPQNPPSCVVVAVALVRLGSLPSTTLTMLAGTPVAMTLASALVAAARVSKKAVTV